MASTSRGPGPSTSKSKPKSKPISSALIEQFCAVTGADDAVAQQLLTFCDGNLEMAVNMHVDSDVIPIPTVATASNNVLDPISNETDGVRAPIPQTQGILVEEAYNFGFRGRKRPSSSVFDGFRDFQAETRWQERELGNLSEEAIRKRKTLEDLFRPPLDLIHRGTFESARDVGKTTNRWLMVNVQNGQEFACQILNRDVWSNPSVKAIIKEHFVFWQVYHDSAEGTRFIQFYKVEEFPYVGILDPRTGEKLLVWNGNEAPAFCESILDFLSDYPSPDGTPKTNPIDKKPKVESIVDISEDQQLEAAIRASLQESKSSSKKESESLSSDDDENDDSSIDLETFDSEPENLAQSERSFYHPDKRKNGESKIATVTSINNNATKNIVNNNIVDIAGPSTSKNHFDDKVIANNCQENHKEILSEDEEDWKPYLGPEEDPKSELLIRFPQGNKKQVSFACSSRLKALIVFVASQGFPESDYELVTTFPKRQLNLSSPKSTLKELGLYPRETIYVQLKNS